MDNIVDSAFRKPELLMLLLCDHVYEELGTGKKAYVGVFNSIVTRSLPVHHARLLVAATLTGFVGPANIELVVRDPSGKTVLRLPGEVQLSDYDHVVDLVWDCANVYMPSAGVYYVDLELADERIGGRRFAVTFAPEEAGPPEERP